MARTAIFVSLALASAALAAPSHAQSTCAVREQVIQRLQQNFGESLAAGGLRTDSQVIEVWASRDSGTWTVLMTQANGVSCVVASGTDWHQNLPELVKMGTAG